MVPSEAYFDTSTARLTGVVAVSGLGFPPKISLNIARIRQAQAIAFGRNKSWNSEIASAIEKAAQRLTTGEIIMDEHLKVQPHHGGGVRSIVLNVDEVLANIALEGMGFSKGEFHIMAPLFQLDRGRNHLETYLTAVHITLIAELSDTFAALESLLLRLKEKTTSFQTMETVAKIQFQEIELSNIGAEFSRFHESLARLRQQLDWFRARLLPCWQGSSDTLLAIREVVGIDIAISTVPDDFPWNVDLYLGLSALLRTTTLTLLGFCDRMRLLVTASRELDTQRIRVNPPFNPDGRELIIIDTVSQLSFSIIGADAAIVASTSGGVDCAVAYAPFFSSQLVWSGKWLTNAIEILDKNFVAGLVGDEEKGIKQLQETPLQAERLIPTLGYDRAVQVARIAALTEKPVRMVVQKMKLMTQEESENFFKSGFRR